jgi:hypothetical protein
VKEHLEGLRIHGDRGEPLGDLDFVSELGVVELKTGGGKGAVAQAEKLKSLVDLPVAVFDANRIIGRSSQSLKPSVVKGLREAGFEVTNDVDRLIDILKAAKGRR